MSSPLHEVFCRTARGTGDVRKNTSITTTRYATQRCSPVREGIETRCLYADVMPFRKRYPPPFFPESTYPNRLFLHSLFHETPKCFPRHFRRNGRGNSFDSSRCRQLPTIGKTSGSIADASAGFPHSAALNYYAALSKTYFKAS